MSYKTDKMKPISRCRIKVSGCTGESQRCVFVCFLRVNVQKVHIQSFQVGEELSALLWR